MALVMFGQFACNIVENTAYVARNEVKYERVIQTKIVYDKVPKTIEEQYTVGCSAACPSLRAYTKNSLRVALKEGDLIRGGMCPTCYMLADVGPARPHIKTTSRCIIEEVPRIEEVVELKPIIQEVVGLETVFDIFVSDAPVTCKQEAVATHNKSTYFQNLTLSSRLMTEDYNNQVKAMDNFFQSPSMVDNLQKKQYGNVVKRGKRCFIKHASHDSIQRSIKFEEEEVERTQAFMAGNYTVSPAYDNTKDYRKVGGQVSVRNIHWPLNTTPSVYKCKRFNKICMTETSINGLMRSVYGIAAERKLEVEIITTRSKRATFHYVRAHSDRRVKLCVRLPHEKGFYKNREIDPSLLPIIKHALQSVPFCVSTSKKYLSYGDSGTVLINNGKTTIVRGRDRDGSLVCATTWLNGNTINSIEHYSVPGKFWEGFNRKFCEMRIDVEHTCQSDFPVELCGEAAAVFYQLFHPCRRITCKACSTIINEYNDAEFKEIQNGLMLKYQDTMNTLSEKVTGFGSALNRIKNVTKFNLNLEASMEIQKLTQGVNRDQMRSLQQVNNVLIKYNYATEEEISKASEHLLKITRWFNNHLSVVSGASLEAFRNKVSGKAMMNPALLCDNQLDKNGNFVWGTRGKHSKRFFSNYFEEVIPSDGYDKYKTRKFPNGTRTLAIGNLIVSTNFEKVRESLRGNQIEKLPITESCVSRQEGSFVHVCCCVTTDDGKPRFSEYKSPTKRHLVIGTTGDAKYVDLPESDTGKMYIAKEGYCYLNIFLAMLLNVNEDEAKDFTKMVRDKLVPNLGMWPTLTDVATACAILSVLHPEARNAELPRILVDHKTKTMHVIDSFGSLTTGYHVLKAGTINQLINFSSLDLTGEMKNYCVGGEINDPMENSQLQEAIRRHELTDHDEKHLLIGELLRCVYNRKKFMKLVDSEPYILLLSLVSPAIILALYNNKSYAIAANRWINRNQNLALIISSMETLAQKLMLSDVLLDQHISINQHASLINSYMDSDAMNGMRHRTCAFTFIQELVQTNETNQELIRLGFQDLNRQRMELVEKNYEQILINQWNELSWLEKFYQIKCYHTCFPQYSKYSLLGKSTNIGSKAEFLYHTSRGKITQTLNGIRTWYTNKTKQLMYDMFSFVFRSSVNVVTKCYKDIVYFVNVLLVVSVLTTIFYTINRFIRERNLFKAKQEEIELNNAFRIASRLHILYEKKYKRRPSRDEFLEYVRKFNPKLVKVITECIFIDDDVVEFESKSATEMKLEQTVGICALLAMIFDSSRSDIVFRLLNKLKILFSSIDQGVSFQSLDEVISIDEEKLETIDFILDSDGGNPKMSMDSYFESWWQHQLETGRVIPHYRTGGFFLEFTRKGSATLASQVSHSTECEFMIRGNVGTGKSTSLPNELSKHGNVLLIEPTRPLAENVFKQLKKDPFFLQPTLRMRGMSSFGSSNITIMTNGFALHFFAHNAQKIHEYNFIIFDECHVLDSAGMAFYCLLREYSFHGKILKVSATPPGKECEFNPLHHVDVYPSESISFSAFAQEQGSGSNVDALKYGVNILVYVASYNDVDQLSKLLLARNYSVTKIDGRTMKVGNVEIITHGTSAKPHYLVATNIIENGVTIDIEVVVDFGVKVVADIDVDSRCMRGVKKPVTYGERLQRVGRVGRVKSGAVIRIGNTETGFQEIPTALATEAAFYCFAYGLPVMVHNVTTSFISRCTVAQAKTMLQFELPIFLTFELVNFVGKMHPMVYDLLKPYKLREADTCLHVEAIPNRNICKWLTIPQYQRLGITIACDDAARIPFYDRNVPDKLYSNLWKIVCTHKSEAGYGKLTSVSACKVAHTLQVDAYALPRTLSHIEHLIQEEMVKKSYFDSLNASTGHSNYSLSSLVDCIRRRCTSDHTSANIKVLQEVKAQLLEFKGRSVPNETPENLLNYQYLDTVLFQSSNEIAKHLELKGKWFLPDFNNDFLIMAFVLCGGCVLLWQYFTCAMSSKVKFQSKKRHMQKLKFRQARDEKMQKEVYGDDDTIEHHFGSAYTKYGKKKGRNQKKGMGFKQRKFMNIYGFDPTDYKYVRFLDPITGHTIDAPSHFDMRMIQDELQQNRITALADDPDDAQKLTISPGVKAYFFNDVGSHALEVDLLPHNPFQIGANTNTIAGFPEHDLELRQSGVARKIQFIDIPKENENPATFEAATLNHGLRNYNPISQAIVRISNTSDGITRSTFGVGYGSCIVTSAHLMLHNNGSLKIQSHHGEFIINNSRTVKIFPVEGRDMLLIRMPKDFPIFPQRLQFRTPKHGEKVCLVSTIFQAKTLSSVVSESSSTYKNNSSTFWKHWITTKLGDCGVPVVSVHDGCILGFHSLTHSTMSVNFYTAVPELFKEDVLSKCDELSWKQHWVYNPAETSWGSLKIELDQSDSNFKINKLISDLFDPNEGVSYQSTCDGWVYNELKGNLKGIARSQGNLVTRHVIKGECPYFSQYLEEHPEKKSFFGPLMDAYAPSVLSKNSFLKDFMKYSSPIVVGDVDCANFEQATLQFINLLKGFDFGPCEYVTDANEIVQSLNMQSATGAMFGGKKRDYFAGFTNDDIDSIVQASCWRLYEGKKGIWNGSLKAELRTIEKVSLEKTRMFTSAPLDTLLGGKVCVDDFNNQFYALHLQGPWTVGITKFYGGWNTLMNKLPDGWLYCDADGSKFDSSLSPYLINAVLQIRLSMMEEWDVGITMLKNLYTEIIYTPILAPDGTIVKKFKGNNSGQPSTVVDNSIMVVLAVYYSFLCEHIDGQQLKDVCVFYVNGDDLIMAIRPDYAHVLKSFSHHFKTLGLDYDFNNIVASKSDISYMSHKAIMFRSIYIPKLDRERIVSILQWDKSDEVQHRAEAICAALIESWGYEDLTYEIRLFYHWLVTNVIDFVELRKNGNTPYLSEIATEHLYTGINMEHEIDRYIQTNENFDEENCIVFFQAGPGTSEETIDAGADKTTSDKASDKSAVVATKDKDVDVGARGPPLDRKKHKITSKMRLPKVDGRNILDIPHLLEYKPDQSDLSRTRASHEQFSYWYKSVCDIYELSGEAIGKFMNGLMVWCIENGTSPNLDQNWFFMDGTEQVEYPIRPIIENAQPTFRQIMAHFSDAAVAYIEMRNATEPYMPRYGLIRNLKDKGLARCAFDFFEISSRTPAREREAHFQMKAAALVNTKTRMFGLDGNVGTAEEDTERHVASDVNRNMHSLLGVRPQI